MIRYVLAVALTVSFLGVATAGIETAGTARSEREVETAIANVDETTTSLVEQDDPPPPGEQGPRRVLEVALPRGGFASREAQLLCFERVGQRTRARYRVDGGVERTIWLDAPLVPPGGGSLDLSGYEGTIRLVLELVQRDREAVVEVTVEPSA